MSDPWMKFYPSDWRSEPRLRLVSMAARGLWVEMLCIMHESDPRGDLTVGGVALDAAKLARMVGEGEEMVSALLAELKEAGVYSTRKNGVIFSRRMEKDEIKRRKLRENGRKGGNPSLRKDTGIDALDNQADKPTEARSQKPEAREERKTATQSRAGASSEVDEALAIYAEVCVPAGLSAVAVVTEKRRAAIRARLKEAKLDGWRKACHAAAVSPFWRGEIPPTDGRPQFKGAIDSFVRPENFAKLIEGGFAARRRVERKFDANQALFGGPA
jgi:hypothetical protein